MLFDHRRLELRGKWRHPDAREITFTVDRVRHGLHAVRELDGIDGEPVAHLGLIAVVDLEDVGGAARGLIKPLEVAEHDFLRDVLIIVIP